MAPLLDSLVANQRFKPTPTPPGSCVVGKCGRGVAAA